MPMVMKVILKYVLFFHEFLLPFDSFEEKKDEKTIYGLWSLQIITINIWMRLSSQTYK